MSNPDLTATRIEPYELETCRAAIDAMREPQATLNTMRNQIIHRYGLGPADQINFLTGELIRAAVAKAPLPDPQIEVVSDPQV